MLARIVLSAGLLAAMAWGQTRPRDPFVFRTAINESGSIPGNSKNRLVALLLNANFTALYSTQTGQGCGLYMTRTGTAQDGNSTYSHSQFGQCLTFSGGTVLHRNTNAQLWEFLQGGNAVSSQTVYRGFDLTGTVATLRYEVIAGSNGARIAETPEYVAGGNGGLRRTLVVEGLAANQSVRVRLSGSVSAETWTANSGGTLSGSNPQYFNIATNGTAVVTGTW